MISVWTGSSCRCRHGHAQAAALVTCGVIDKEAAAVSCDFRRPEILFSPVRASLKNCARNFPMQQVARMKKGELRFPGSGCRCGPVLAADADHGRVWTVTGYDRVVVLCRDGANGDENEKCASQELGHILYSLNKFLTQRRKGAKEDAKKMRAGGFRLLLIALTIGVLSAPVAAQADAITDHLQRAADLIRKGELALAEKQLDSVFKREPREANALNLLGVIRAQQQRPREAEQLFLRAIEANKSLFGAYLNIGQLYLQKGERRRAEEYLVAALEIRPDDVPTLQALANIARADGDLEKALSYLVRARKIAPDSPEVLYDFGWTALNMNLLYDALTALEQLHRMKVADPQYLYPLAIARLNNGQAAEALTLINEFIKSRPQDGRGYYVRGAILYGDKRFAEARTAFQRSLSLMPYPDTEYYLGMIAHHRGEEDQAISLFRRALRSDPSNPATHVALGIALARQKDYQAARVELERAIELDPKDQTACYQLGLVYARLGDKDRSQAMFAAAEKLRAEQKERQGTGVRLIDLPK